MASFEAFGFVLCHHDPLWIVVVFWLCYVQQFLILQLFHVISSIIAHLVLRC